MNYGFTGDLKIDSHDTNLVGFARKEHGTIADTQSTLLLLAFGIDFGNGPCLDGVGLCLVRSGCHSVRGVYIGADRPCRSRRL